MILTMSVICATMFMTNINIIIAVSLSKIGLHNHHFIDLPTVWAVTATDWELNETELWETVSGEGFNESGTFPKTNYLNKGRPRRKINLCDVGTGSATASASLAVTETAWIRSLELKYTSLTVQLKSVDWEEQVRKWELRENEIIRRPTCGVHWNMQIHLILLWFALLLPFLTHHLSLSCRLLYVSGSSLIHTSHIKLVLLHCRYVS